MSRTRKFLQLAPQTQGLLVESWMLLLFVRWGLRLLSFPRVLRFLEWYWPLVKKTTPAPSTLAPARIAWAVDMATRYQYGTATCLPQALTAYTLLRRNGFDAQMRIGVAYNSQRQLEAHAWVEYEGVVVLGALPDLARFNVLPSLHHYSLPGAI